MALRSHPKRLMRWRARSSGAQNRLWIRPCWRFPVTKAYHHEQDSRAPCKIVPLYVTFSLALPEGVNARAGSRVEGLLARVPSSAFTPRALPARSFCAFVGCCEVWNAQCAKHHEMWCLFGGLVAAKTWKGGVVSGGHRALESSLGLLPGLALISLCPFPFISPGHRTRVLCINPRPASRPTAVESAASRCEVGPSEGPSCLLALPPLSV